MKWKSNIKIGCIFTNNCNINFRHLTNNRKYRKIMLLEEKKNDEEERTNNLKNHNNIEQI